MHSLDMHLTSCKPFFRTYHTTDVISQEQSTIVKFLRISSTICALFPWNCWKDSVVSGEITKPTIIREPAGKTCYEISDKLSLNCTASIGTTGNEIIWEEAHHEGRFSTITNETDRAKLVPADQVSYSVFVVGNALR